MGICRRPGPSWVQRKNCYVVCTELDREAPIYRCDQYGIPQPFTLYGSAIHGAISAAPIILEQYLNAASLERAKEIAARMSRYERVAIARLEWIEVQE